MDNKRGRDGKTFKRSENTAIPVCPNPKCGRHHKGKCILDRDLDVEQKALDFARKLKAGMGKDTTAAAEARAIARANKVSFEDLNEDDYEYSLSVWNPD